VDKMHIWCLKNWVKEKVISNRKLFKIKTDNQEFLNFIEKISYNIVEELTKNQDVKHQNTLLKNYFKEAYWLLEDERTICIEFDEEVSFCIIIKEESKFTELTITNKGLLMYNGITNKLAISTHTGYALIFLAILFSDILTEFVTQDKTSTYKLYE
jgi:hypothetical protein